LSEDGPVRTCTDRARQLLAAVRRLFVTIADQALPRGTLAAAGVVEVAIHG
jgi:hypothetical protein